MKVRAIKLLVTLCAIGAAGVIPACQGRNALSPVIAEANGLEIRRQSFEAFLSAKIGELTAPEVSESVRSQMLDEYIKRRLVLEEATRAGVSITDSELEQAAIDSPHIRPSSPTDDARNEYANDLLIAKYYRQIIIPQVHISADEVQHYLEENRTRLADRPAFYVREIRVDSSEQAEQLRKDVIERKLEFSEAARLHSQAPSAEQGGLARYSEGQLPDLLETVLRRLGPGDISPVAQSSFGFHIFKLERRVQPLAGRERRPTLNELESNLVEELIGRKNQEAVDQEIERILSSATILIRESHLGFTYAGRLRHNQ